MNISRYANIDKFVNIRYIFLLVCAPIDFEQIAIWANCSYQKCDLGAFGWMCSEFFIREKEDKT